MHVDDPPGMQSDDSLFNGFIALDHESEKKLLITRMSRIDFASTGASRAGFSVTPKQQDAQIERVNDTIELSEARLQTAAHNE
jgi:hypothetical protein